MLAVEVVQPDVPGPTASGDAPDPVRTAAIARACHDAGLLALTCGTYGNVLRFLPPLIISDDELRRGAAILERAMG
jgi:4-aminobutyrate aminotransferase/(S)-3-amino-2-methylpropionate transaminase